jgi:hypothetical protein
VPFTPDPFSFPGKALELPALVGRHAGREVPEEELLAARVGEQELVGGGVVREGVGQEVPGLIGAAHQVEEAGGGGVADDEDRAGVGVLVQGAAAEYTQSVAG